MTGRRAINVEETASGFFAGAAMMALLALGLFVFTSLEVPDPPLSNTDIAQAAKDCERLQLAVRFKTTTYGQPVSFTCTSERHTP